MFTQKTILPLLLLALLSACEVEEFAPAAGEANTPALEGSASTTLPQLLHLVNQLRSEGCDCGNTYMPPVARLTANADLEEAALRHAADMNNNNFFDHTGSDGSDVSRRVTAAGYQWQAVGENIAWGYSDMASVFLGWKNSPGHCRNMMSPHFRHLGSARVGKYWVQAFARPRAN